MTMVEFVDFCAKPTAKDVYEAIYWILKTFGFTVENTMRKNLHQT